MNQRQQQIIVDWITDDGIAKAILEDTDIEADGKVSPTDIYEFLSKCQDKLSDAVDNDKFN